jgi:hypothetical protein
VTLRETDQRSLMVKSAVGQLTVGRTLPAPAFAQSRASGCRGPHDRFCPPAASRPAIALATTRSSKSGPIAPLLTIGFAEDESSRTAEIRSMHRHEGNRHAAAEQATAHRAAGSRQSNVPIRHDVGLNRSNDVGIGLQVVAFAVGACWNVASTPARDEALEASDLDRPRRLTRTTALGRTRERAATDYERVPTSAFPESEHTARQAVRR